MRNTVSSLHAAMIAGALLVSVGDVVIAPSLPVSTGDVDVLEDVLEHITVLSRG